MDNYFTLLLPYAYNILGSRQQAEDVVQDVMARWLTLDQSTVAQPRNYLIRAVIHQAINEKHRQRRMSYPGTWLPEPVATEGADSALEREQLISYSLAVLLENLPPRERAVYVLKEAFSYRHEEIAEVLDIRADHSRQLLSRARRKLADADLRSPEPLPAKTLQLYLEALQRADMAALEQLLRADIAVASDGGGQAGVNRRILHGVDIVGRLEFGLYRKFYHLVRIAITEVNHQPALVFFLGDRLMRCQIFEVHDGRISRLYNVLAPGKLKNLKISPEAVTFLKADLSGRQ